MGALRDRAKKMSKFIKLEEGEEIEAIYMSAEEVNNRFDPDGGTTIRYTFEVDGEVKMLDSNNKSLMIAFDEMKAKTKIIIKRTGTQFKTKYSVEEV